MECCRLVITGSAVGPVQTAAPNYVLQERAQPVPVLLAIWHPFVGQSLDAQMTGTDEYALLIDLHSQEAGPIGESSLAELKLLERQNLQSWGEAYPEMVGGDLML